MKHGTLPIQPPEIMKTVSLYGLPFDGKSSYLKGAALAPERIRKELYSPAYNAFSESVTDVLSAIDDAGDLPCTHYEQIGDALDRITLHDTTPIFLGGDHSVSYHTIRRFHTEYGRTFHVLHFDAHGDLYDTFDGDRYSHACPFARVMEEQLCLSLTQVGIRSYTPHQEYQVRRFGIEAYRMRDVAQFRPEHLKGPLFISLDIDVLDPAFAPGVSHHEAGGITSRQLIDLLHAIRVPVIGADLVEFNPLRDVGEITGALCAKLVKELTACVIRNR